MRNLTKIRTEAIELVAFRPYNIYPQGTIVTVIGELDDDCGNTVNFQIKDSEDTCRECENVFWDYFKVIDKDEFKSFWFEANIFSGKIDSQLMFEKLKKECPNYEEAKQATNTMFGLANFGFYGEHKDNSLGKWLNEHTQI